MNPEILFFIGNNGTLRFTFYDQDRNVVVITGGELTFSVKSRETDTLAVINKCTDDASEGVIVDGAAGIVEFYLVPGDTVGLRPWKYVYDIQFEDSTGKIYTLIKDVFELVYPVTA